MRLSLSLLLVAVTAPHLLAQTWSNQTAITTRPSPRRAGAMAFDGAGPTGRMILHGGLYASPSQLLDETWAYGPPVGQPNGQAQWTLLVPTSPMPGRWGHQLVSDTLRNRLVTFGGRSPTITGLANDTYAWNGTGWTALSSTVRPAARYLYGLCYDSLRDRVVLFGGRTLTAQPNDTWEFDGTAWQQVTTATAPAGREEMVMTYDAGRGVTVLFGGLVNATSTLLGDTWEYGGTDWVETTPAVSPTPRYRCAGAYDIARQRVIVYGGYDGTAVLTETVEYSGADWTTVTVGPGSTQATQMYAGFDAARGRMITFGGVGTLFSSETWEYTGRPTAQFGLFGNGCDTSLGLPSMEATILPRLGQTFTLVLGNLPQATGFAFFAQGFSFTTWGANPLPYDLTPFGAAGCSLLVSPDALFGIGAANGSATLTMAIPNTPSLQNLAMYLQAFIPDDTGPNGFGGMTRGGRAVLGQ